jgi:hypothetical protein
MAVQTKSLKIASIAPPPHGDSWRKIDIAAVLSGDLRPLEPTVLTRADGLKMLYPGRVNALHGAPESMKSWLAQMAVVEVLQARGQVLYLDFESEAPEVAARLLALGASHEHLISGLNYVRPAEAFDAQAALTLVESTDIEYGYGATIIDGVTASMDLCGKDLNSNSDVAAWWQSFVSPLRGWTEGPVVMVDHVVKSREGRNGYAIGAQHKQAAIDGAIFGLTMTQPFGRGRIGIAKIKVEKDRPGALRAHTNGSGELAQLRMASGEDGQIVSELLLPAGGEAGEDHGWQPTGHMDAISRALESSPAPLTQNDIEHLVPGRVAYKRQALAALVANGYVERVEQGRSFFHRSIKAFREVSR